VVLCGLAFTDDEELEFKPVDGDHEYEEAPETVIETESPKQILVEGGVTDKDGD
jgi:hypothetical protein